MRKKKCIAMLLAGGQGSRLKDLTKKNAKPAVSFGGKYRIIDFSLSNCVSSGIDTVGVLTQYKPTVLNAYLGNGEAWDLDNATGGVHVLPPYETESGGSWYLGTADAIYHNIDFVDTYDPEYVLILSGDHLYMMDYSKMLEEHKKNQADLTVSVMTVPWEEASRFGIMEADDQGRIQQFVEKPPQPASNLASMGIYIFSWPVLRQALMEDHDDPESVHDFGKNIIPTMLSQEKRLFVYRFSGYWKDVGTIDSYYSANMELLEKDPPLDLYGKTRIFSNSNIYPPHFVGPQGSVATSIISNGCRIYGAVEHSVLGSNVTVGEGALVKDSILLPGAVVEPGARVYRAILAERSVIRAESIFGTDQADGPISLLGDDMIGG
jgi:glucose-1-phosphate adenylyltransferase